MSGPYHAFDRAMLHLILIVSMTLGAALALWAVLAHMGVLLPLPLVVVGVAAVAVSAVSDGWRASRAVPPAPPPAAPHRTPTWEDAERMAALHRQGLVTREQLDAVLRELVPPPPPAPPVGRRRR